MKINKGVVVQRRRGVKCRGESEKVSECNAVPCNGKRNLTTKDSKVTRRTLRLGVTFLHPLCS
jgi:hypothetical protein